MYIGYRYHNTQDGWKVEAPTPYRICLLLFILHFVCHYRVSYFFNLESLKLLWWKFLLSAIRNAVFTLFCRARYVVTLKWPSSNFNKFRFPTVRKLIVCGEISWFCQSFVCYMRLQLLLLILLPQLFVWLFWKQYHDTLDSKIKSELK